MRRIFSIVRRRSREIAFLWGAILILIQFTVTSWRIVNNNWQNAKNIISWFTVYLFWDSEKSVLLWMSINKMKGIIRSDLAYLAHASMSHLIIISPPVKKTISVENCDVDFFWLLIGGKCIKGSYITLCLLHYKRGPQCLPVNTIPIYNTVGDMKAADLLVNFRSHKYTDKGSTSREWLSDSTHRFHKVRKWLFHQNKIESWVGIITFTRFNDSSVKGNQKCKNHKLMISVWSLCLTPRSTYYLIVLLGNCMCVFNRSIELEQNQYMIA